MPGLFIAASLAAAAMSAANSGKKPNLPGYVRPDPAEEQKSAIKTNAALLPSALSLAHDYNIGNQDELLGMMRRGVPGYDGKVAQAASNVDSYIKGELTPETEAYLKNKAAAWAVNNGQTGGELQRNLTMRDLGRSSSDLQQQWTQNMPTWMNSFKSLTTPQLFDPSSLFLSPQDWLSVGKEEAGNKFQRNVYQSQIDAMPDPQLSAIANGLSSIGGMAGGMFGQGGGGGGTVYSGYQGNPYRSVSWNGGGASFPMQ